MRFRLLLPWLALALLAGCGQKTSQTASQAGAPAAPSASPSVPPEAKSLPEQLADAHTRLRAVVEAGTLDEVHVHAFRVRDLAGALADQVSGLSDADRDALRADAAAVAQAAEALDEAGDRGDLGATRAALAALETPLVQLEAIVSKGKVEAAAAPKLGSHAVAMTGELIDPQCYFTHDSRGPDHASCALNCARGGQDLAFLDEGTGRVYPLISAGHGKNPNDGLFDHVGKPVEIEGVLFKRQDNEYLLIQNVAAHAAGKH